METHAGAAGTLVADYCLEDGLGSSVAGAPSLANLGPGNAFASEAVGGTPTRVLGFPEGSGLILPTDGLVPVDSYSVIVHFRFTDVDDYRRVLHFDLAGGSSGFADRGLYVIDGQLDFHDLGANLETGTSVQAGQYVEVALTRNASDTVTLYANGQEKLAYEDGNDVAVLNRPPLTFFVDVGGENSAGAVDRIRLYNGPLTSTEMAAASSTAACNTAPATPGSQSPPANVPTGPKAKKKKRCKKPKIRAASKRCKKKKR